METTLEELVAEVSWLRGLAGDLAHDAYLIAQANPPPPDRPRRPWLLRVTRNLARMRARSAVRAAAREAAVAELAPAPPTPEELVARLELHRVLATLVLELAPALRDVVLLHYVEGLTSAQIGNRLGLASGTVRWRLKQAVDELRERLDEKHPNRAWVPPILGLRRPAHKTAPVAPATLAVLAVAAAVAIVAVQWRAHAHAAAATELPSSPAARQPHRVSFGMTALAYREHDDDNDAGPDWHIRGRVIDEGGAALGDARIAIEPMCPYGGSDRPEGRSQRDGQFTIDVPPDCSYFIYAEQGARGARFVFPALPTEPVTLVARPVGLVLHVVDSETHAPVRDVRVERAWCGDRECAALPEVNGATVRVTWERGLIIAAPGYDPQQLQLDDAWQTPESPPPLLERTIELAALHPMVALALGVDGEPLVRTRVQTTIFPWQRGEEVETDASGRFTVLVASRDPYLAGCGGCIGDHTVCWRREAKAGADLVVRQGSERCPRQPTGNPSPPVRLDTEIAVTVLDEKAHPVRNAEVRSFGNAIRPLLTDTNGRAAFHTDHAFGDVYARRGSRMSPLATVEAGGGHREYTLRLQPAAITGIVVDTNGDAVAKAWLRVRLPFLDNAYSRGRAFREVRTDDDGHFGFVLPPGSYVISAFRETSIDDSYDAPNATTIATDTRDVTFEVP